MVLPGPYIPNGQGDLDNSTEKNQKKKRKKNLMCWSVFCLFAAIRRKENGWYDEDHPLVFLFLGSSGIG